MNILFLDQFSEIGGAQRCLLDLLPGLRVRGWTAHAAIPGDGPLAGELRKEGVRVHSIRCGPYGFGSKSAGDVVRFATDLPRLSHRVATLAEQLRPDLLYVNGPRVLPAAAFAAGLRVPLLFHSHSRLAPAYNAIVAGNSLRFAGAAAIACCRYAAEPLEAYLPPERLRVIYNGVPDGPRRSPAGGRVRIGVVGRIAPQKGQAEFVEAARILVEAGAPCEFVVCGAPVFSDGSYFDRIRKMAEALPVQFTGWQDDVPAVLTNLDLLAVPSLGGEPGAPRVILEAYAAGVPVVAFRSGGIPEIVSQMLVEPPTPAALAKAIQELIAAPEQLAMMADTARALWRERYTVERYRGEVLDTIERVTPRTAAAQVRTAAPR
jgi:glycosyltransferase involved in cell wall biosynthesis